MDSPLEDKRTLHEQRDRLELAIVDEMLAKKGGHKDQLDSQHRQKLLLDKYMQCSGKLLHLYNQQEAAPRRPSHADNITQACGEFYISLKKIMERSTHSADDHLPYEPTITDVVVQPTLTMEPSESDPNLEYDTIGELSTSSQKTKDKTSEPKTEKLVEFTDEEGYGRYLDLNKCHEAYLQVIKRDEVKPNYLAYLTQFRKLHLELEREKKLTSAYKTYLDSTLEYFRDYSCRSKPLFDYREMESKVGERFTDQWNNKTLAGWFSGQDRSSLAGQDSSMTEPMVELESYTSLEQLIELGLDCLKRELQVRGLKCGGTLEDRATRLWSIRGLRPEDIDESLKSQPTGKSNNKNNNKRNKKRQVIEPKYIASIEAKLISYVDYYNDHRLATIENVQRKQARTAEERNDSDDDISEVEDEEDEHGDVVYNPKNLPLGWDGKPIPYWLYKLHGLNLTFTCEICGNATYKGPKTFQRHFAEQRHAHGMKCLAIPNTAHFANITKIADAISLWDKLKSEKQKDQFQAQVEEEYEDSQGNVVNKKIYEDLKRQGLL